MSDKNYSRVKKQRKQFYQENGFSYQGMVKWINANASVKWGKMDNDSKNYWKSRYMEVNGYGNA